MTHDRIRQLAAFAIRYEALLEEERRQLGLASWDGLRTDWWLGLRFFLDRAFYQGRRDTVSTMFKDAACSALESLLGREAYSHTKGQRLLDFADEGWFQRAKWQDARNPAWTALCQQYPAERNGKAHMSGTGKPRDREMVLDSLRFVTAQRESLRCVLNLADYAAGHIEAGEIMQVHDELQTIRQIGPKVAAFFLRDLVAVLGLQRYLEPADYGQLQPVDTWISQIAQHLAIAPTGDGLAEALAAACREAAVDPIRFNQGAWYLGAHSFSVLLDNLDQIKP